MSQNGVEASTASCHNPQTTTDTLPPARDPTEPFQKDLTLLLLCCHTLQAEQMLLTDYTLTAQDIPRLFEAEPWLIEPGALLGSVVGLQELFRDRDPARLLLQHACTGGSKLLQEFKQQAMEACQIATEYMGGQWLY